MLWFIPVVMLVLAFLYGYIAWRLHHIIPAHKRTLRLTTFSYLVLAWLTSLGPITLHYMKVNGAWVDMLAWFVYLNMGFFSLLFIWYLAVDALFLIKSSYRRWVRPVFAAATPEETNSGRRDFMSYAMNVGVVGAAGSLTGIGVHQAVGGAIIKEVRVPLVHTPQPLKGLRIVQFTDLHIGPMIKRDYVKTIVEQMNQLKPDIIVMTGDLVDGSVSNLKQDVAPLADLEARYGKYFITGNHEYYSGVDDWVAEMKRLGFKVLLNEHQLIEHEGARLLMAGVTDYRAHRHKPEHLSSPAKAMQGAPEFDVSILLAHQPKSIDKASEAGFDLQISGHTHGGQYYPWNFIAQMANPYIKGLHKHQDKTWIYVSPGTGYWGPPIRLGNEPEITVLRLS